MKTDIRHTKCSKKNISSSIMNIPLFGSHQDRCSWNLKQEKHNCYLLSHHEYHDHRHNRPHFIWLISNPHPQVMFLNTRVVIRWWDQPLSYHILKVSQPLSYPYRGQWLTHKKPSSTLEAGHLDYDTGYFYKNNVKLRRLTESRINR